MLNKSKTESKKNKEKDLLQARQLLKQKEERAQKKIVELEKALLDLKICITTQKKPKISLTVDGNEFRAKEPLVEAVSGFCQNWCQLSYLVC